MVKQWLRAWQIVLLLSVALGAVSATLEVEHAFGGSGFRPAGKLLGNLLSDTELEWQRPALTSDDMELLEKTAESDGLYSVRLQTPRGTLLSSVPAKCLLLRDFAEHVAVAAGRGRFVEAFNYDVHPCSSVAPPDDDVPNSFSAGGGLGVGARPTRLRVRVQRPAVGPLLSVPEVVGAFADVSVDAMDMSGGAGAAAYDPNAKPRAVPAASGGQAAAARKGGPPEKDERTWLQKNWLIVAAVCMMVMNMVMKTNAPQPQQGGAPAPGAGAGAVVRRG